MSYINPFLLSVYLHPDYFCDRENEKNRMINAFQNQRNLTLISHRKYGKTSLIYHTFYHLKKQKQLSLFYIDLMHTTKLEDFVIAFAQTVLGKFDSRSMRLIKQFSALVKSIRPMISYDPLSGKPAIELFLQPGSTAEHSLNEIFNYLESQPVSILIAFDEFQQIHTYPEKNVEALLRSRIQKSTNCHFIFSGSEKHFLYQMFTSYNRPFYQSTEILDLGKIDKTQYLSFIARHFESAKRKIGSNDIEYILDFTRQHTWYAQFLCNRLFGSGIKTINTGVINEIIENILLENTVMYDAYLRLLTGQQLQLLKAIASEGSIKKVTSHGFIQKHNLTAASTVKSALTALIAKEMIFDDDGAYRLYDVFFSHWLSKISSL